jgi:D-alanine--poly(phosphoribitol) ligase subunit 1
VGTNRRQVGPVTVATASALQLMLRHAGERPSALAVKDDRCELSYGQLAARAEAMASGLRAWGVSPGDRVVLLVANSADFVVLTLACLWLGAPWVPLDSGGAPERARRLVSDAAPALVVLGEGQGAPAHEVAAAATGWPALPASELLAAGRRRCAPEPAEGPEIDAYVVYTSGTVGAPKGARVPERAFRRAIVSAAEGLGLGPESRTLVVSPFHFDGSYGAVFPTLVAGGCAVVPRREELLFLRRFFDVLGHEKITHASSAPSYLRLLLSSGQAPLLGATSLETFALGGEACVASDVARLWELAPQVRVFNRYGPTEATIAVTNYEVSAGDVASGEIPIGAPVEGTRFYLLGPTGDVVQGPRETGELCIGGEQLMSGYWGDPVLSAKVLVEGAVPGEVVYKTGDLAYRDERGLFYWAGRCDDVVKRNGVRVSLEEVSSAFRKLPGVSGAACLPVGGHGRNLCVAFVEAPGGLDRTRVFQAVRSHLPEAMWPDDVVVLKALPLSSAGKVNRQALVASYLQRLVS